MAKKKTWDEWRREVAARTEGDKKPPEPEQPPASLPVAETPVPQPEVRPTFGSNEHQAPENGPPEGFRVIRRKGHEREWADDVRPYREWAYRSVCRIVDNDPVWIVLDSQWKNWLMDSAGNIVAGPIFERPTDEEVRRIRASGSKPIRTAPLTFEEAVLLAAPQKMRDLIGLCVWRTGQPTDWPGKVRGAGMNASREEGVSPIVLAETDGYLIIEVPVWTHRGGGSSRDPDAFGWGSGSDAGDRNFSHELGEKIRTFGLRVGSRIITRSKWDGSSSLRTEEEVRNSVIDDVAGHFKPSDAPTVPEGDLWDAFDTIIAAEKAATEEARLAPIRARQAVEAAVLAASIAKTSSAASNAANMTLTELWTWCLNVRWGSEDEVVSSLILYTASSEEGPYFNKLRTKIAPELEKGARKGTITSPKTGKAWKWKLSGGEYTWE